MSASHPFAHIAPGPYRYLGAESTADREALAAASRSNGETYTTNMCGGSCDHCGTAISDVHRFRGSDSKVFKVGSSCVFKALGVNGEHDPNQPAGRALVAKVRSAKRSSDRRKRHAREATKIAALETALGNAETAAKLAAMPHPVAWRNDKGETLLDSLRWTMDNAGNAGKVKAAKTVAAALAA